MSSMPVTPSHSRSSSVASASTDTTVESNASAPTPTSPTSSTPTLAVSEPRAARGLAAGAGSGGGDEANPAPKTAEQIVKEMSLQEVVTHFNKREIPAALQEALSQEQEAVPDADLRLVERDGKSVAQILADKVTEHNLSVDTMEMAYSQNVGALPTNDEKLIALFEILLGHLKVNGVLDFDFTVDDLNKLSQLEFQQLLEVTESSIGHVFNLSGYDSLKLTTRTLEDLKRDQKTVLELGPQLETLKAEVKSLEEELGSQPQSTQASIEKITTTELTSDLGFSRWKLQSGVSQSEFLDKQKAFNLYYQRILTGTKTVEESDFKGIKQKLGAFLGIDETLSLRGFMPTVGRIGIAGDLKKSIDAYDGKKPILEITDYHWEDFKPKRFEAALAVHLLTLKITELETQKADLQAKIAEEQQKEVSRLQRDCERNKEGFLTAVHNLLEDVEDHLKQAIVNRHHTVGDQTVAVTDITRINQIVEENKDKQEGTDGYNAELVGYCNKYDELQGWVKNIQNAAESNLESEGIIAWPVDIQKKLKELPTANKLIQDSAWAIFKNIMLRIARFFTAGNFGRSSTQEQLEGKYKNGQLEGFDAVKDAAQAYRNAFVAHKNKQNEVNARQTQSPGTPNVGAGAGAGAGAMAGAV